MVVEGCSRMWKMATRWMTGWWIGFLFIWTLFVFHNVNANETFWFPYADPLQAKKVRKVPPGLPSSVSAFFKNLMLNKLMSSIQYLLATRMDLIGASGHALHSNCSLLNKIIDWDKSTLNVGLFVFCAMICSLLMCCHCLSLSFEFPSWEED